MTKLNYVTSYRTWRIAYMGPMNMDDLSYGLMSTAFLLNMWTPREIRKAICYADGRSHELNQDVAPDINCACGYYALKKNNSNQVISLQQSSVFHVSGRVAGWGGVIEHELGYRFEYAYPLDLTETNQDSAKCCQCLGEPVSKLAAGYHLINWMCDRCIERPSPYRYIPCNDSPDEVVERLRHKYLDA